MKEDVLSKVPLGSTGAFVSLTSTTTDEEVLSGVLASVGTAVIVPLILTFGMVGSAVAVGAIGAIEALFTDCVVTTAASAPGALGAAALTAKALTPPAPPPAPCPAPP